MGTHVLKTTLRTIRRNKGYAFINIFGLALGLGLFLLIALYVQFEYSFDTFHEHDHRIYRVEQLWPWQDLKIAFANAPLGPILVQDYPEIIDYVRTLNMNEQLLDNGAEGKNYEEGGWYAEDGFFRIFSFRLLEGDPQTALTEPFSIILTKSMAKKYFPEAAPLGRTLKLNNDHVCRVTGVIQDCPANSTFQYDFLISFSSYRSIAYPEYFDDWNQIRTLTFVLLSENASVETVNEKIRPVLQKYYRDDLEIPVYLEPLSNFHFHTDSVGHIGPSGDSSRIRIFAAIGLFILCIAAINFVNLTTARSGRRVREVGVRKVIGATRRSLFLRFMGESFLFAGAALLLGFLLAGLFLPEFESVMGRNLTLNLVNNETLMIGMLVVTLLLAFLSGIYPALYLSSFHPIRVLKGPFRSGASTRGIRHGLVIFQFTVSVGLIIGALIIQAQTRYIRTKDLGYDTKDIIVLEYRKMDEKTTENYEILKNELASLPAVSDVGISRHLPTDVGFSANVIGRWEGSQEGESVYAYLNYVDPQYLEAYGFTLLEGRNFYEGDLRENAYRCIINETAVRQFGWEPGTAAGKRIGEDMQVIGVIQDYHARSFRESIPPVILHPLLPPRPGMRVRNKLSIRIATSGMKPVVQTIRTRFETLFPDDIFEYRLYEDSLGWLYRSERRTGKTVGYFSLLAACIGCLGLFGLASFTAEQKTKEIGVRKVLGASVPAIVRMMGSRFLRWIGIANLVAWPFSFWAMSKWLNGFAYHTRISLWAFVLAALLSLALASLTVVYQTVRAARRNPVTSLKYAE